MKLLILTQKVDKNDPILGFFHRWIIEFSKKAEKLTVICLQKGDYDLPDGIKVISLGKEIISGSLNIFHKLIFIFKFFRYIVAERKNYDVVLVHMNQEYVILGFLIWKILGKKILLWRNHPAGNLFTDLAVFLSDTVFCTSNYSYTAKFRKTKIMPVGIDTDYFKKDTSIEKIPNSLLYVGRISRIKGVHLLIEALNELNIKGADFYCDIVGDAYSATDREYLKELKKIISEYDLDGKINFVGPVSNTETAKYYNLHEVLVNLSPDGMFDKVIFEAMSCEALIVTSNKNLKGKIEDNLLFQYGEKNDLADKLGHILRLPALTKNNLGDILRNFVLKNHSIIALADQLKEFSKK